MIVDLKLSRSGCTQVFPEKLSTEASKQFIVDAQKDIEDRGFGLFAVERRDTGEFIGFTGIQVLEEDGPFRLEFLPCIEIGWPVSSPPGIRMIFLPILIFFSSSFCGRILLQYLKRGTSITGSSVAAIFTLSFIHLTSRNFVYDDYNIPFGMFH